jgi:hypothetical protein
LRFTRETATEVKATHTIGHSFSSVAYVFSSVAYVWVRGAKTTGPIAKVWFFLNLFFSAMFAEIKSFVM